MKHKPVQIDLTLANGVSPEENILRGLFTYFLNQGVFDDRMQKTTLEYVSLRNDHVGVAFFKKFKTEIKEEFYKWVGRDKLATYLMSNDGVRSAFNRRIGNVGDLAPFDTILGARYKEVTGLARNRMPKDLKKSFYTKAYNRLLKFATDWNNNSMRRRYNGPGDPPEGRNLDIKEWLEWALSKSAKDMYLPSKHLREIKNLYWKTMKHERVEDVVRELLNQATVAGIMLS